MKKANTPLELLFKNTKDIEELKQIVAPFYKSSVDLSNDSVSVDVENTNLPTDTEKAYIIDINGNVYKFIAFNDNKTIAYIEYYTTIKGADGADGKDGADDIDDTTTADNKLWSSQKTNTEISRAKDKGIYYTLTQPTEILTDIYSITLADLENVNSHIDVKTNDLILYIDADGKISEFYKVNSILVNVISMSKIGEASKGKTLYQHNIRSSIGGSQTLLCQITNDKATEFTAQKLLDWLGDNGFTYESPNYYLYPNASIKNAVFSSAASGGIFKMNSTTLGWQTNGGSNGGQAIADFVNFVDNVIEL